MDRARLEQILGSKASKSEAKQEKVTDTAMPTLSKHLANKITFKKDRDFGQITMEGFPVSGSDVTEVFVTFTTKPSSQDVLVFTEIAMLLDEVKTITNYLAGLHGTIWAVHNHWTTDPATEYVHWEKVGDAYKIAEELAPLWKEL